MQNGQPTEPHGSTGNRPDASAGFTLVELAIAVAVVLIGVLALFALISSGLDSSVKAVADTRSAIFAESVFNAIGAKAQVEAEKGMTNGVLQWRKFWSEFANGTDKLITLPASPVWKGVNFFTPISIYGDGHKGTIRSIRYTGIAQHASSSATEIQHGALRYQLIIDPVIASGDLASWDNVIERVTLRVWGSEFGSADLDEALIFYQEFDNPGDL